MEHSKTRSAAPYVTGFVLSLILTLAAYMLVANHLLAGYWLIGCIAVLAVAQFVVQMLFFLHLADEQKPRWNLMSFMFALLVVVIVVFGSVWIMYYLDYHHGEMRMTPEQTEKHIIEDEGLHTH